MGFPKATAGGGSDFKPVSAGIHPAICVGVIDFGVQEGSERFPKPKHKVHLRWACLDETVEWEKDGQKHSGPAIVGRTYTYSLAENGHMRPMLESWRARPFTEAELEGFDVSAVAGKPCQVSVVHESKNGKTYANVKTVVGWPKGVQVPECATPVVVYSPSDHKDSVFNALPEWMRDTIEKRLANDYAELDSQKGGKAEPQSHDFDDDIPF